jgi:glutamate racemase
MSHQPPGSEFTIGLFDSGVGGLSVLRQLERVAATATAYNNYRFVYLGDTARCPYGNREPSEIVQFVSEIGTWLECRGVNAIVMACNTSAACAAEEARSYFNIPVHDLIAPTAEHVASLAVKTAVLATASTVQRRAFSRAIAACNPAVEVLEVACPELVPIIERGEMDAPETLDVLWNYVRDLRAEKVKALILGCTHYPFLTEQLAQLMPETLLIDPAEQLARALICAADSVFGNIDKDRSNLVNRELFVTGSPDTFSATAEVCLGQHPGTVYGVSLDELLEALPSITVSPMIPNSSARTASGSNIAI